ncbi:MAG: RNA polymerase sigma factor [Verrucomicrobia bacterium]|nr:MAG: RNA polymerase sigma factor [Verrucomicrobiota bacterium]
MSAAVSLSPSASAWRDWLITNGPRLMLFAKNQTRNAEDAEDVLQDALVKLVEKINNGSFDGGQDMWMAYLYTTIRRLAIDLSRKDDRRRKREDYVSHEVESEAAEKFDPWFDSDASDDETRALLESGLKDLPSKFSEVVILKIWGEKTFAEIGEMLDISLNTAASRYRYGLDILKRKLIESKTKGDLAL